MDFKYIIHIKDEFGSSICMEKANNYFESIKIAKEYLITFFEKYGVKFSAEILEFKKGIKLIDVKYSKEDELIPIFKIKC